MEKLYRIQLTPEQRKALRKIVRIGRNKAKVITLGLSLTLAAISTYNGTVTIDLSQTADADVYKGSKDGTAHSLQ
jgi:hypothetical protein